MKSFKRQQLKSQKGRIFRPFLYLLFCGLSVDGICQDKSELTFSLDSFNYSEANSLYSISGRWSDTVSSGNKAVSISRLLFGYQYQNFSIQAINRDDSYMQFNNETLQFIYLTENRIELEKDREYVIAIQPDKASSEGIRLGFKKEFTSNLRISGFFSLLRASNIVQGNLQGQATALATNDYDFSFSTDLVYEDDPLFERETGSISGDGYSIDLMFDYRINDDWSLNLQLLDIAGELSIDNAPFTLADATSDIKVFDENGYLQYDPVISGLEGFKDVVYQFEMQTHLEVVYRLSEVNSLIFQHHRVFDFEYQKLELRQQLNRNQLGWVLIPEFNAAGFSFNHPNFSIGLEADSFNYKKMKYLNLNTQFFWAF